MFANHGESQRSRGQRYRANKKLERAQVLGLCDEVMRATHVGDTEAAEAALKLQAAVCNAAAIRRAKWQEFPV